MAAGLPPIDHVTIAGDDLQELAAAFSRAGLPPTYGGKHGNGVTHMSLLGFPDGSYIELISTLQPGAPSPWWHDPIHDNAGPCAWAVRADDIHAEARRLREHVPVSGPDRLQRDRPDGTPIAWQLAFPGEHHYGACLPFLIMDETDRALRVLPTECAVDAGLTGIEFVFIATPDAARASQWFSRCYDLPTAVTLAEPLWDCQVLTFPGTGLGLLHSAGADSLLDRRIRRYADLPAGYLIGIEGPSTAFRSHTLPGLPIDGRRVVWFKHPRLRGLGLIETQPV